MHAQQRGDPGPEGLLQGPVGYVWWRAPRVTPCRFGADLEDAFISETSGFLYALT